MSVLVRRRGVLAGAAAGLTVEYLMVAGGGAGGCDAGKGGAAGGGAGGLIFRPQALVSPGTFSISVGGGGAGISGNSVGANGSNSSFLSLTAIGGGGGGFAGSQGADGGSGGGSKDDPRSSGLQPSESGDSGSPYGFGNGGGRFLAGGVNARGAGGGGAGEAGEDQDAPDKGAGGDGLEEVTISGTTYNFASIFGSAAGETVGGEQYFAGGGGRGGSSADGIAPDFLPGGLGGGGDGADGATANGDSGLTNTGGGGGGTRSGTAGSGGSGVLIFDVPAGTSVSFAGGVTQTSNTIGDREVYTVTQTDPGSTVTIG